MLDTGHDQFVVRVKAGQPKLYGVTVDGEVWSWCMRRDDTRTGVWRQESKGDHRAFAGDQLTRAEAQQRFPAAIQCWEQRNVFRIRRNQRFSIGKL